MQARNITLALALACALTVSFDVAEAAPALAYTAPSGLNPSNYGATCPPRVNDPTVATAPDTLSVSQLLTVDGSSVTVGPSSVISGGPITIRGYAVYNSDVDLYRQDSNGNWDVFYSEFLPTGVYEGESIEAPSGPIKAIVTDLSSTNSQDNVYVAIDGSGPSQPNTFIEQELADACYRNEQQQAATQSDLTAIGADVTGLGGSGSNVATLRTLDTDLQTLDTDVKAVTAAVNAQAGSGSGSGGDPSGSVSVSNWPTDQTVGLDTASSGQLDGDAQSEHDDLWVIVGVIVGCFAFSVVLRKVWP